MESPCMYAYIYENIRNLYICARVFLCMYVCTYTDVMYVCMYISKNIVA
jgi:hypothetical protein